MSFSETPQDPVSTPNFTTITDTSRPTPTIDVKTAEKYGLLPSQTTHRTHILGRLPIQSPANILELGCGQGDCTVAVALLYPDSHITAIDPAPRDYGSPETLGQAHERIKKYACGERITFHQVTPVEFLAAQEKAGDDIEYDVAIMCHSLWYFSGKAEILDTLKALGGRARHLCIAEWGLKSASSEAGVHVLAALTRACCEAHIPHSDANIRSPLSPDAITQLAAEAGWTLHDECYLTPGAELEDGRWEVNMLLAEDKDTKANTFLKRARSEIKDDRVITVLESMLESVRNGIDGIGGVGNAQCMDVWVANFAS